MTYAYKTIPVLDQSFNGDDAIRNLAARIAAAKTKHYARILL